MKNLSYAVLFILYFFVIPTHSYSQDYYGIDTLKRDLQELDDPQSICYQYLKIANRFLNTNIDSTMYYSKCALNVAKDASFDRGIALSYFINSYVLDEQGEYIEAIDFLEQSILYFEKSDDITYLSDCYNNLGVLYSYTKDQERSLEYYIKSVNASRAYGDSTSLAQVYSNIGEIYELINEHGFAAKYYGKALEIDLIYEIPDHLIQSYLDLGYIYVKLDKQANAYEMISFAEELLPDVQNEYYRICIYEKFAKLYSELGDFKTSEKYIQKFFDILDLYETPLIESAIYEVKAQNFLSQSQYHACISAVDQSLSILQALDHYSFYRDLYLLKSEALFGLKAYKQGYEFLQKARLEEELIHMHRLSDRLLNFEKQIIIEEEYQQLELQNELDRKEIELVSTRYRLRLRIIILIVFILIVLITIALYMIYTRKVYSESLESHIITIEKQKQELEDRNVVLHEKEISLIQANATKDKFFSIIGHDLKNPFNSIAGISSVLVEDDILRNSDASKDLLTGIEHAANTGNRLLENLLHWARSQSNILKVNRDKVLMNEIFENVSLFLKAMANEKKVHIEIDHGGELIVNADYHMIELVVRNLASNAIKFSYPDGKILLSAQLEGDMVEVHVQDFGRGMSKEMADLLFTIEGGIQAAGTSNEKGTGLGLVLSKEFVEKNGGTIRVESVKDQGSVFIFTLPKA